MDLSANICGCCCTVFPRSVLGPVDGGEQELVGLLVGADREVVDLQACPACRAQLGAFSQWLMGARANIAKLRQIRREQQVGLANSSG